MGSLEELSSDTLNYLRSQFLTVEHVEIDKTADSSEIEAATSKRSSWSSNKGQTEAERLQERMSFIISQSAAEDAHNLMDVAIHLSALRADRHSIYETFIDLITSV